METAEGSKPKKKDKWEIAQVLLEPVGGLLTALAVAALGFFGSRIIERQQRFDSNFRLYSELMSKREESESSLRKDMFKSIIDSFLKPGMQNSSLDAQLLNIELLAYNFHESLNLKPLFLQLEKSILALKNGPEKSAQFDRLERLAREVTRKQMLSLEEAGDKFDRQIDLDSLKNSPGGLVLDEDSLTVDNITRLFRIVVLEADRVTKNIKVRLEVRTLSDPLAGDSTPNIIEFWISFFDFPQIDNTRLSHDQRCAIVMTNFDEQSVDLSVLAFPGSHASLREKPYFDEIINNLREKNQ
ncbi:MAG TPA: hypothetical protein VL633_02830 [Bacteroidota bacterium]|jgi:hypothetical protein|nr:hypothetical protein [Bacteroidota bacterium]